MEVIRKGYTLNGRVIRPALVIVASSSKSTKSEHLSDAAEENKSGSKRKHHGRSGAAS
jgi:hypothetical protein